MSDALRKARRFFPAWSRAQRETWARRYLSCKGREKAPISSMTPKVPAMFPRTYNWEQ